MEKQLMKDTGISSTVLMENAGKNSADLISEIYYSESFSNVYIVSGKGNNAGDGFVAARHLCLYNIPVDIIMLYTESELKGDALLNYNILKSSVSVKFTFSTLESFRKETSDCAGKTLIVDAIFGTGFKGELPPHVNNAVQIINKLKKKFIVSLDVPSGLYDHNKVSEMIKADMTISMGTSKIESLFQIGKINSGEKIIANIGIPSVDFDTYNKERIFLNEPKDFSGLINKRNKLSHKYKNGKVFVLAGSKNLSGAAVLCSASALRTGSGAVILGFPESLYNIIGKRVKEVMSLPLPENGDGSVSKNGIKEISEKINWCDSVLIGPGLSKNEDTSALISDIILKNDKKMVVDADGIIGLKRSLHKLKKRKNKIIIAPHIAEFSRLINMEIDEVEKDIFNIAKNFAKKYKLILMLKNAPSIITDGENIIVNSTGKENLATAGTGDILSGITASLYSNNDDAFAVASMASYIHGRCGDLLYSEFNDSSIIASDLLLKINEVKEELGRAIC
ncbi:bifunctional ADP-dependent NAD(P)H-hydrate dehydratase/NAD(P)H-hydrate epimerase [soil metagenome]